MQQIPLGESGTSGRIPWNVWNCLWLVVWFVCLITVRWKPLMSMSIWDNHHLSTATIKTESDIKLFVESNIMVNLSRRVHCEYGEEACSMFYIEAQSHLIDEAICLHGPGARAFKAFIRSANKKARRNMSSVCWRDKGWNNNDDSNTNIDRVKRELHAI